MTQTILARKMLAQIEKDFFKGAGLAKACQLKGDERRDFRLAQVERLLTEMHGASPLAVHLSDMFWTADEGRRLPQVPNPLTMPEGQQMLTDKEMSRLQLILEVAGLCHDVSLHFVFDLKDAFGVRNKFWVSNKQLVEWLSSTQYEHIAIHTAYTMKRHAINVYANSNYLPAQDELAELFSSEYGQTIQTPSMTNIPPRAYVEVVLDALLQIDRHWQRGRRLKLKPDLVMLHDEIYGLVPHQFDKSVLNAAQALYDYMDNELQGQLISKSKSARVKVLGRFADKVREVRSQYLADSWVRDLSLEFAYLMAHAERCGYGQWPEEDNAL